MTSSSNADESDWAEARETKVHLPPEPYTVIRATLVNAHGNEVHPVLLRLGREDRWSGEGYSYDTEHLEREILDFEILAEPWGLEKRLRVGRDAANFARRQTAKAVLDKMRSHPIAGSEIYEAADDVAADFGVVFDN